jgi:hypothetical protein
VMFLAWQFIVGNLLSVVLVMFPDIFVNLYYYYYYYHHHHHYYYY